MKKLVVYYSFSGNTRAIAKRIARALKADLAEIRTMKTYPDDYDVLLSLGKREVESGYMPQIVPLSVDPAKYETILIGTPVWWGTYAPALRKFFMSTSWKGKTIHPFATNDRSLGHIASDLKKALRGATVKPVFSVKYDEKTLLTPAEDFKAWLSQI